MIPGQPSHCLFDGRAEQSEDKPEVDRQEQRATVTNVQKRGRARQGRTSPQQEQEGGRLHQAAAEIVENLPA